jgi:hypothetical protein
MRMIIIYNEIHLSNPTEELDYVHISSCMIDVVNKVRSTKSKRSKNLNPFSFYSFLPFCH